MEIYVDDMIVDRTKLTPKKYEGQILYEAEVSKDLGGGGRINCITWQTACLHVILLYSSLK